VTEGVRGQNAVSEVDAERGGARQTGANFVRFMRARASVSRHGREGELVPYDSAYDYKRAM